MKRVLIGFGLAALVGVPLGIAAGSWRVIEAAGAPLALFGRNLPVAALIPLTILWFGIDETQKVMFIFIACVPFVYSDAVAAIANVPDRYIEAAQTLGASSFQIVRKVLVRARAAGHLQQPAPPVRAGVRLHHARRADQRAARARIPADGQPAARAVRAHHSDPHHHWPARVRDRSRAVLVPARSVPAPAAEE